MDIIDKASVAVEDLEYHYLRPADIDDNRAVALAERIFIYGCRGTTIHAYPVSIQALLENKKQHLTDLFICGTLNGAEQAIVSAYSTRNAFPAIFILLKDCPRRYLLFIQNPTVTA